MPPKMGKRAVPMGPGRPKDMMPKAHRKAMGMNVTPAMMKANRAPRFGKGTKK